MWATMLEIETFTEYYHTLKVCINISLNLVSKLLLPQIWIIVNDIFEHSWRLSTYHFSAKGEFYML